MEKFPSQDKGKKKLFLSSVFCKVVGMEGRKGGKEEGKGQEGQTEEKGRKKGEKKEGKEEEGQTDGWREGEREEKEGRKREGGRESLTKSNFNSMNSEHVQPQGAWKEKFGTIRGVA